AFLDVLYLGIQVEHDPVVEGSSRRIGIFDHQGNTARVQWQTFEVQGWHLVLAVLGVFVGDLFTLCECLTGDFHDHLLLSLMCFQLGRIFHPHQHFQFISPPNLIPSTASANWFSKLFDREVKTPSYEIHSTRASPLPLTTSPMNQALCPWAR